MRKLGKFLACVAVTALVLCYGVSAQAVHIQLVSSKVGANNKGPTITWVSGGVRFVLPGTETRGNSAQTKPSTKPGDAGALIPPIDMPGEMVGSDAPQRHHYVGLSISPFLRLHDAEPAAPTKSPKKSNQQPAGPYDDFVQTDASIKPGNNTGSLIDTPGEVVGIDIPLVHPTTGLGLAIPSVDPSYGTGVDAFSNIDTIAKEIESLEDIHAVGIELEVGDVDEGIGG